jgi:DNA-binding LacI/PurR family transcriptional regulator
MMNAIEMAARDAGYFAISISVDPHDVESIVRGVDHLRKIVIDGMIVMTPQSDSVSVVEKRVTNIPVVYVDIPERTKAKTVSVDNRTGGKVATQHLIELGHKNILHISGPERWFDSKPRRMGYEEAVNENKLTPVVAKGDWGTQTGYKVISEWDFKKNPITAVFAANDLLALGVMRALHDRGIAVPEQVSVIGYDDTPEAQYYEPPLTTMHQDFALLGKEAMEYLVATLNKIEPQKFAPLVPNLVVRKSTGRPPKK